MVQNEEEVGAGGSRRELKAGTGDWAAGMKWESRKLQKAGQFKL